MRAREGSVLAGLGAVAFSVFTTVGIVVGGAPGGNYAESDVTNYVAIGHLPTVIVTGYLALVGVLGLICVFAYLRELVSSRAGANLAANIFWGTGLTAAASMAVAWGLVTGITVAAAEGGTAVASVSRPEVYMLSDAFLNVFWGSGGVMLGFALISLMAASRGTLPGWLRWLTLVIGIFAVGAPAYFPAFVIPIWGVVVGAWIVAAGRVSSSAVRATQPTA